MKAGTRKLTREQYDRIQTQYDATPPLDAGYSLATGEHWILKSILDRMGFYTSGPTEAYYLAEKLLSEGCDEDSSEYPYAYH